MLLKRWRTSIYIYTLNNDAVFSPVLVDNLLVKAS